MARGSRHARKLARTFQLRDWSVGLSGARQCVAQNGVTRAAGSGSRRGQCHGLLTVGWSYSYKELDMRAKSSVALYSTCPPYRGGSGETYLQHVRDVARWSEAGGCEGILVYTDNSLFDPWLVSQVVVEATRTLTPLVAVQPVYMHPYTVAKMMATLSHLYGRRIDLNMVAGGFKNDLLALNDETPHDARYERLVEYTSIILQLLAGGGPPALPGPVHPGTNLTLVPKLDPALSPRGTAAGSSEAGLAAARGPNGSSGKSPGA